MGSPCIIFFSGKKTITQDTLEALFFYRLFTLLQEAQGSQN
jgi:hypothetical protein